MNDYYADWETYHAQDLLGLWELLDPTLRLRTTPAEFRAWVYEYTEHLEYNGSRVTLPSLEVTLGPEHEESDETRLQVQVEESYVRMYCYCEENYLPLLQQHTGALAGLQYLCYLSA